MRLHYAEVLNPRKVCALAKHVGLALDYVWVDLGKGGHRTPAFRALNPNGKVPVLEDEGQVLWESDAILCHLARRAGTDLFPRDDARQIETIRWMSWNQVHFQPLGGTFYFEHVIKTMFRIGQPDADLLAATVAPFSKSARVLEDHLANRIWLVGDGPTVADFTVASVMPYAEACQLPIQDFAAIRRWYERLNAFEAWRDPYPVRAPAA